MAGDGLLALCVFEDLGVFLDEGLHLLVLVFEVGDGLLLLLVLLSEQVELLELALGRLALDFLFLELGPPLALLGRRLQQVDSSAVLS